MTESDKALPVWLTRDATRWAACRPATWARPVWAAAGLVVAVAIAVGMEPHEWGAVHVALAAAQLYWYLRLPELTLIAAPGLAAWLICTAPPAAYAPVLAALTFGWAAARHRTSTRRRQRLLAANAADGTRLALPRPVPALWTGTIRIGLGAALAVPSVWVPALGPVALAFASAGAAARYRAARLRRRPVPVLRALAREDEDGRLWVYAGDDTAGRRPLFSCPVTPETEAGEPERAEPPAEGTRLRPAVLFGAPYEGGALLLLCADRDGGPLVDRWAGPVRPTG
ncbi:hypothetical protein OG607_20110 [Streptomyces sp. NBC_01537]|uniref:hypothetical protein n=1 Tax=Streptomyces sp. NBC_01537 TaxID=2903896 RepID=UPI0038704E47